MASVRRAGAGHAREFPAFAVVSRSRCAKDEDHADERLGRMCPVGARQSCGSEEEAGRERQSAGLMRTVHPSTGRHHHGARWPYP